MATQTVVKKGRPPKLSFNDKKNILDWYIATECAGDTSMLKVHGVYTRVAMFARSSGLLRCIPNIKDVKDTDFSKDTQIRTYMDQLIRDSSKTADNKITESAFTPLDVEAIVRKSPREQREALAQYNQYNQRVYLQASKAIEEHINLSQRIKDLQNTVNDLITENKTLSCELNVSQKEVKRLTDHIRALNKTIANTVTPVKREQVDQQSNEERLAYGAAFAIADLSFIHARTPADTISAVEPAENTNVRSNGDSSPDELEKLLREFGLTKEK